MTFKATTSVEDIRAWVDEHGGVPALCIDPESRQERLAIAFNDATINMRTISWEEFFDRFESQNLALRYESDDEEKGEFAYSFISRDEMDGEEDNDRELPEDDIPVENMIPSVSLTGPDAVNDSVSYA